LTAAAFAPAKTTNAANASRTGRDVSTHLPVHGTSGGYTTDEKQALRVADGIEAGMVFVSVVFVDGAELPFGGVKRSGSGRELGRLGADEFVNKKMIRIG
jgi:succinate-semialdehyde dehydrogenase/glutarate-semialdehyde dehydrogenase